MFVAFWCAHLFWCNNRLGSRDRLSVQAYHSAVVKGVMLDVYFGIVSGALSGAALMDLGKPP